MEQKTREKLIALVQEWTAFSQAEHDWCKANQALCRQSEMPMELADERLRTLMRKGAILDTYISCSSQVLKILVSED